MRAAGDGKAGPNDPPVAAPLKTLTAAPNSKQVNDEN